MGSAPTLDDGGFGGVNTDGDSVGTPKHLELEDLACYESPEELVAKISGETIKHSLQRLGLKCGGKPLERAQRLLLLKNTPLEALPKSAFAPMKSRSHGSGANEPK